MFEFIKRLTPWFVRIFIKSFTARIPISYSIWAKMGLFRHGLMDNVDYAWDVVQRHKRELHIESDWKALELGPGDSVLSAFISKSTGSSGLTLVDAGQFAEQDVEHYKRLLPIITRKSGYVFSVDNDTRVIDDLLKSVGAEYYTDGLESLRSLESNAFDLIYSQAVLEHVKKKEFVDVAREFKRLLAPSGVMSHVIDFKDHLGGGLNNMRFPETFWEKSWFATRGGFYTNRLSLSKVIKIFEEVGFSVTIGEIKQRKGAVKINRLYAEEFRDLSEEDRLVTSAHLVMTIDKNSKF